MEPLYLVDGSGYIFRAFYAIQPLSNSKGLPTNALLGFTRMLLKLIREADARYIAVAFDAGKETFRHELYPLYKANRTACPDELSQQMPYFRKIVEAMGITCLEKQGIEADDIIGTVCRRLASAEQKVVIVSGDKDLTQLVDGNVEVWDAMRDVIFSPATVKEKLGVDPEQVCDYLALIGDSSDNVPGVRGIGPKTAQRLLEHFRTLDNLLENVGQVSTLTGLRGAASIQEKLQEEVETLHLSRTLVCLDLTVEPFIDLGLEDLRWRQVKKPLLRPLLDELELSSLRDAFGLPSSDSGTDPAAAKNYSVVTAAALPEFAEKLAGVSAFAFDTETTSLDCFDCSLVGIAFSWEQGTAYYLPLANETEPERNLDAERVRSLLNPIFSNPRIEKYGLNLKFDYAVLVHQGYQVEGMTFDGMICSYVLNPDIRGHGLKALAKQWLDEEMRTYDEVVGDCKHLGWVAIDSVAAYACHDAEMSWCLKEKLHRMLSGAETEGEPSLRRVFQEIEMPLVPVLADMERAGVKIDVQFLQGLGAQFSRELELLRKKICELAGCDFNLNSPKQVADVLFDRLGIATKGAKKNKSGFSTDASVLAKLAGEHEIAAFLLEYRELFKLNTTYVEALQRLVRPATGRIHTSFNQAVAATGRLSSSEPNLQNIPVRNEKGRQIRRAFIADPDSVLISADYSQIELRVLAHLSGDPTLKEAFITGEDIHERTARELFGEAFAANKDLRRVAKTINFGIIYGMGAMRLAAELGVSRREAQTYIDAYFARYSSVLEFFDRLRALADRKGYVTTIFGRRRYLRDLDTAGRDAGYAGRSMVNAPIQGSAAEIIKVAMINLHRRFARYGESAKIVLQVHDELVVEATKSLAPEVRSATVEEMEQAVKLTVPLKVDVRVGTNWGELK